MAMKPAILIVLLQHSVYTRIYDLFICDRKETIMLYYRFQAPGMQADIAKIAMGTTTLVEGKELSLNFEMLDYYLDCGGNCLDTARRYARACVTLRLSQQAGIASLRVCDDGPGIPPALRERVFDRFFQAEGHRGAEQGGAGLGLSLARGIARLHGGDLRVEDGDAPGAVFLLTLPQAASDGENASRRAHALRKREK